jgi:hypothetical protein
MTLQEKELLTRFLEQLASAEAGRKDAEAEALIKGTIARQPDAAYLLVQRALQLEQLLQASQEQVKALQAESEQPRAGSSGRFFGDPHAWGSRPIGQQPLAQQAAPAAAARAAPGGSWASGLFGNIAATAAGVVAGSFLFQGIQGMMNRGDSGSTLAGTEPVRSENLLDRPQPDEPELLNTYNTLEAEAEGTSLADLDDPSDFG